MEDERKLTLDRDRLKFDIEKFSSENQLRKREIELKENESKRWITPLVISVFIAALAAFSNAGVAWINGYQNRELEDKKSIVTNSIEKMKAEASLILEAIKTDGDTLKAKNNLTLLYEANLLSQDTSARLSKYLNTAQPKDLPALSSSPESRCVALISNSVKDLASAAGLELLSKICDTRSR